MKCSCKGSTWRICWCSLCQSPASPRRNAAVADSAVAAAAVDAAAVPAVAVGRVPGAGVWPAWPTWEERASLPLWTRHHRRRPPQRRWFRCCCWEDLLLSRTLFLFLHRLPLPPPTKIKVKTVGEQKIPLCPFHFLLDPEPDPIQWWSKPDPDYLISHPERIEWFIEGQAFLRSSKLAPPTPPPPLWSASCLSFSVFRSRRSSLPQSKHRKRPLSGVHSIMLEKSALASEGEGCTSIPFHSVYHHVQSSSVSTSWMGRYTHPISSL